MQTNEPHRTVGARVHALRTELGLTCEDLAARASVEPERLAAVEDGTEPLGGQLLARLCLALDITPSDLFSETAPAAPIRRRVEQWTWTDPDNGAVRCTVSPAGTSSPTDLVAIEFPPGAEFVYGPQPVGGVERHVLVLDGAIDLEVDDDRCRLELGDCLYVPPRRRMCFRNPTGRIARFLVVVTRS